MAYNANTNWDNEKKYLESLISGGSAGQQAWAANQLNELNTAKSAQQTTGGTQTTQPTGGTASSGYTPIGTHDDATVKSQSQSDTERIQGYKDQWAAAQKAGDTAGMEAAHAAAEAIRQGYGYSGGIDGSDYFGLEMQEELSKPTWDYDTTNRPTYDSMYTEDIDALLNQILNRDDFSYDINTDPLYAQYKQQYLREGQRAMDDTLASAAASAGGMNSYAINAAQQANNYYNAQLNDVVPELYQMAYDMYLTDIDNQVRDLGLLNDMDYTQYSRYRDTMGDWENDRDFAYNKYRDDVGDYYTDIGLETDNSRYENEWNYNTSMNDKETAYNRAMDFLNAGVMPSATILSAAGISTSEAQAYLNRVLALDSVSSSGGSSGSRGSGGNSKNTSAGEDKKTTTEAEPVEYDYMTNLVYKDVRQIYDQHSNEAERAEAIAEYLEKALDNGVISDSLAVTIAKNYGIDL